MLGRVAGHHPACPFSNKVSAESQEPPLISFGLKEKSHQAAFAELKKPLHMVPECTEKPLWMTLCKGWWSISWCLNFKSRRLGTQKRIWWLSLRRQHWSRVLACRMLCKSELDFWTKSQPSFCYHYAQETKWSVWSLWIEIFGPYLNFCSLQMVTCKVELPFWWDLDCDPGGFVAVNSGLFMVWNVCPWFFHH